MDPAPPMGKGVLDPLLLSMPEGAKRFGRGVRDLVTGGEVRPTGERSGRLQALADMLGGAMHASTPLMLASGIAAPVRTAAALVSGTVAGTGAAKGAEALGASPAVQELTGATAGLVVGGATVGGMTLASRRAGSQSATPAVNGLDELTTMLKVKKAAPEPLVEPARYVTQPTPSAPPVGGELPRQTPAPRGMTKRVPVDAERVTQQAIEDPSMLGGHRTMRDIQAEAQTRPIGPRENPHENFKDSAEAAAYVLRRKHEADRFNALDEKRREGTLTAEELPDYEAALEATKAAARDEIGGFSELGRSLRIGGQVVDRSTWSVLERGILQAQKAGLDDAAITDVMRTAANSPDAWIQAMRAAETAKRTWRDWARSYYSTSVLSDPLTQIKNFVGSGLNLSTRVPMIPVRAAVDAIRVAMAGGERSIYAGEVGPQLRASIPGAKKGAAVAADVLRQGYSTKVAPTKTGAFDLGRTEFQGGEKNPANMVGRAMEASDQLFRQTAIEMDRAGQLYTRARNRAKAEGVEPDSPEFDRILDGVMAEGPTRAIEQSAELAGARTGFNEQGGPLTQSILNLKHRYPELHYAITFVRTIGNLTKQGLEWTPAGALLKGARPSQVGARAATEVQARSLASLVALMPLGALAAAGRLSGSGPRNPAERQTLLRSGWQPNSIKIGDAWHSYSSLQPLAMPMSLVANAYEAWTRADEKTDLPAILFNVALGSARSVLQQSYFANVNGILQAINDETSSGGRVVNTVARTASGFIPASGLLRAATRTVDPTLRRPTTTAEAIGQNLPIVSERIAPRLDQFGQPVQRLGSSPLTRALNPFVGSPERRDPVLDALSKLEIDLMPAAPDGNVLIARGAGQAALSKRDALTFGQNKGQALYDLLRPIIERPDFKWQSRDRQFAALDALIRRARDIEEQQARAAVLAGQPVKPYGGR